jgi:hypothetical protein
MATFKLSRGGERPWPVVLTIDGEPVTHVTHLSIVVDTDGIPKLHIQQEHLGPVALMHSEYVLGEVECHAEIEQPWP